MQRRFSPWFSTVLMLVFVSALLSFGMQFLHDRTIRHILGGNPPTLFYRSLAGDLLDDYGDVIGIAHNAGNSRASTAAAQAAGADGIEIDINAIDDRLYATHSIIPVWIGAPDTEPLTINDAWKHTAATPLIQFDFKSTSSADIEDFVRWLQNHPDDRTILVSARAVTTLAILQREVPWVFRMLSIGTSTELEAFQENEVALGYVQGVAIQQHLLNSSTLGWLQDRDLAVLAWIVNDVNRLNDLVRAGVDAITTDNLAILELLSQNSDKPIEIAELGDFGTPVSQCAMCPVRTNPLLMPMRENESE